MILPNGNYLTDLAGEVIRTNYLGPFPIRYLIRLITLPYLLFLYISSNFFKIDTPESCTGYYVLLRKQ